MSAFHGRRPAPPVEKKASQRLFTRPQIASMMLSLGFFFYSLLYEDIALSFLTISFLLFMLLPLIEKFLGAKVCNMLRGMAMGLGFGSLVLAFL